jgi:hypothetical protein
MPGLAMSACLWTRQRMLLLGDYSASKTTQLAGAHERHASGGPTLDQVCTSGQPPSAIGRNA